MHGLAFYKVSIVGVMSQYVTYWKAELTGICYSKTEAFVFSPLSQRPEFYMLPSILFWLNRIGNAISFGCHTHFWVKRLMPLALNVTSISWLRVSVINFSFFFLLFAFYVLFMWEFFVFRGPIVSP
jgi:hypothetical protein